MSYLHFHSCPKSFFSSSSWQCESDRQFGPPAWIVSITVNKCHRVTQSSQTFLPERSSFLQTGWAQTRTKDSALNKHNWARASALKSQRRHGRMKSTEQLLLRASFQLETWDWNKISINLTEQLTPKRSKTAKSLLTMVVLFTLSTFMQPLYHSSIKRWAGARTWAFISLRTNKGESVDTMALFCCPTIIQCMKFSLTGCQGSPVFIITKWWEKERKTSSHMKVVGKRRGERK